MNDGNKRMVDGERKKGLLTWRRALLVAALATGAMGAAPTGHAAPKETPQAAEEQALQHLELMVFRLRMFQHEASSSLLSSFQLPVIADYLRLPESRANKHDPLGRLELSDDQNRLRKPIEEWAIALHKRFPIGEICLIDRHGQEHMRVNRGIVQPPIEFSSAEAGSPFFALAFSQKPGDVFMSQPYMSADVYKWVVGFAAPVPNSEGGKQAIFHFEVPLSVYQNIVATRDFSFSSGAGMTPDLDEEGRFFIVDQQGLLIADSRQPIDYDLKAARHPEKNPALPDYLPPEKIEDYLPPVTTISQNDGFLAAVERMQKGEVGSAHLQLNDGRSYVLSYRPVPDRPWSVGHLDPVGGPGFWEQ